MCKNCYEIYMTEDLRASPEFPKAIEFEGTNQYLKGYNKIWICLSFEDLKDTENLALNHFWLCSYEQLYLKTVSKIASVWSVTM